MTGNNPPAALIPREPTAPTARYSAHPMFDETGTRPASGRSTTSRAKCDRSIQAVAIYGFLVAGSSRQLPARVRTSDAASNKHPRSRTRWRIHGVLANAPGETFSRVAAANALRQLYAEPTGNDALSGLDIGSILGGGGSQGPARTPSAPVGVASGPAAGGTMTRAELRAVAQQLRINEQEAEQHARARGLSVRYESMARTLEEQETIARFDRTDGPASLYTASPSQARRWQRRGYPVQQQRDGGFVASVPKSCITFRKLKPSDAAGEISTEKPRKRSGFLTRSGPPGDGPVSVDA